MNFSGTVQPKLVYDPVHETSFETFEIFINVVIGCLLLHLGGHSLRKILYIIHSLNQSLFLAC